MQDRGLAAYIAELVGTFFLVLVVGTVVTLFVATSTDAQQGSDSAGRAPVESSPPQPAQTRPQQSPL